ncbi:hypothetical protein LMG33818_000343 [Halomonadaceae bacterium LMG 33818]|uniref:HopJ type III effector protein n=1 Tax=Cernens ardua TaxID=3402176 RepID=UPI003EDCAD0A
MKDALAHFRQTLQAKPRFSDTLAFIEAYFEFTPTAFTNHMLMNQADENQGSCRIIALAKYADFSDEEALLAFGEHYRHVRSDPHGNDHANIRTLMEYGLDSVSFEHFPLVVKQEAISMSDSVE